MLTLEDLVENGTISADGAAILRDVGRRAQPFLVHSLPRNAGKSTVTEAILAEAPPATARHAYLGTIEERDALLARPAEGYVVVAEMGHRGPPGYLAEDEIVRTFELADHGYSLASSLHADDVDGVCAVLGRNDVTPATIARAVRYLVKVQPLGDPFAPDTRRIVEAIHEVTGLDAGGRLTTTQRYG